MKLFPTSALLLLQACATLAHGGHDEKPVQICAVDYVKKVDACLAMSSYLNSTTDERDLRLHMSVKFFDERKGWMSFGVGDHMDLSLMFIMYPGLRHDDVTVSVRTTHDHMPPTFQYESPYVRVEKTWFDPFTETHNAQMICYTCERWKGQTLELLSKKQNWIWASNSHQSTRSDDVAMSIERHSAYGFAEVNMQSSYFADGEENIPEVTTNRVSTPKFTINWAVIHGLMLSGAFFILTPGVFAIRSGLPSSFKLHWMIQLACSIVIFAGCLLGLKVSIAHGSFTSIHQFIGYTVPIAIVMQCLFGYKHHLNFVKLKRRTQSSHYHIWLGRILIVGGNFNIGLGLKLADASAKTYMIWMFALLVQLVILITAWSFWSKSQGRPWSMTLFRRRGQPVRSKDASGYEGVEQDAFIVGDEAAEEFEDDDADVDKDLKKEGIEMK